MLKINSEVKFFINLAKIQAIMNRRFDSGLGGLGFNEFIILYHLSQAEGEKMRRIDLAEKIGLTASGVTRLLLPMEKVGLVKKEVNKEDARSSLVMLSVGGKRKLEEGIERAELLLDDIIPSEKRNEIRKVEKVLADFDRIIK